MLVTFIACDTAQTPSTTEMTTTESAELTTPETTTAETTTEETAETTTAPLPHAEEIAQAVDIAGKWAEDTLEVPLLVLIVSYDADGDGVNDYDENDPTKLYRNMNDPYFGEQWAGTKPEEHYDNIFGESNSLSSFFLENSMGYFRYVPVQFDEAPENADPRGGIMGVTVNLPHNNSGKRITPVNDFYEMYATAVMEACDPYLDFSQYDTDKDGILTPYEMGIVVMVSGQNSPVDKNGAYSGFSENANETSSRFRFSSMGGNFFDCSHAVDGVVPTKLVYQAEFEEVTDRSADKFQGMIRSYFHTAHELAHTFGAWDLADNNDYNSSGIWPTAYALSNEHSRGYGYLDPFHRIHLGWAEEYVVEDGIYTIHSTSSKEYAVLRLNTPNPDEYYLVEIRLPVDCDYTLSRYSKTEGGIMVWHIDESGLTYTVSSMPTGDTFYYSANPLTGALQHPVMSPLLREGYNTGKTLIANPYPADPFYTLDDVCNTGSYYSFITGNPSMYVYPDDWTGEKNFNIKIEVLSEAGDDMTIRITGIEQPDEPKTYPEPNTLPPDFEGPYVSVGAGERQLFVGCDLTAEDYMKIKRCGVILSASSDFTKDVIIQTNRAFPNMGHWGFYAFFDGLSPNTKYYVKAFVDGDYGYRERITTVTTGRNIEELPPPKIHALSYSIKAGRLYVQCMLASTYNTTLRYCGIIISSSPDFSENVLFQKGELPTDKNGKPCFEATFNENFKDLKSYTKYYVKAYTYSSGGYQEEIITVTT